MEAEGKKKLFEACLGAGVWNTPLGIYRLHDTVGIASDDWGI